MQQFYNNALNRFIRRWSLPNYKRMMCLEESFYNDYISAVTYYKTVKKILDGGNIITNSDLAVASFFKKFHSIYLQINDEQPSISFSFDKNIKEISGNFMQFKFPGIITIPVFRLFNKIPNTIEGGVDLVEKALNIDLTVLMSLFHEYFHFLFENGLSTEEFKMFNNKTKESEFNSYTKELMIQLLASNDSKFFSKEEDLKKAYDEFEDTIETKKNLLQICNDEQLILDTLLQYNKSYELKESFDIRAEIDMLTLCRTKPLYTTTLEDLEKFIKTLENNLGKNREQIFQEIKEMIKSENTDE